MEVFKVFEKDNKGQFVCEYFGEDREGALQYLKMRNLMLTQQLKGWQKETGINRSIWRKDDQMIDLYFDMQQVDIDEEEMLQMYNDGMTAVEIAKYYGCSDRTIGIRLKKYNVNTKQHQKEWLKQHPENWKDNLRTDVGKRFQEGDGAKPVYIKELNKSFSSLKECSQWLLDNGYTKAASMEAVRKSLSRHLNGDRDSYLKMHFEYL